MFDLQCNGSADLHTESGYGLRTGLWPRQSSHMQQKRYLHTCSKNDNHGNPAYLKPILSKPFETEKIQPDAANGACAKIAIGHEPVRKP